MSDSVSDRTPARGIRRALMPFAIMLGLTAAVLASLWFQRAPLADNLIARELAARGVRASYHVAAIGLRTQRIENIVLGDPVRPDLTARWVEVDIGIGGLTPRVTAIRAGGVRMRAALRDGRLRMGVLDRFMGPGDSAAAALPDVRLALSDARVSLATEWGPVGLAITGAGHLRNGFTGRVVGAARALRAGGCVASGMRTDLAIAMRSGAPSITGPVTGAYVGCPAKDFVLTTPRVSVNGGFDARLARFSGRAVADGTALRLAGLTFGFPKVEAAASGEAGAYTGTARFSAATGTGTGMIARAPSLSARFRTTGKAQSVDGTLALSDLEPRDSGMFRRAADIVAGTPLAPLGARLGAALAKAARDNRLTARIAWTSDGRGGSRLALTDAALLAANGAFVRIDNGRGFAFSQPGGAWTLDGSVRTGGGGLPEAVIAARQSGRGATGSLVLSPYAAGSARLSLAPAVFSVNGDGRGQIATTILLDGPIGSGGSVRGLNMPLALAFGPGGAFALNSTCVFAGWRTLQVSTVALGAMRTRLCPLDGAMARRDSRGFGGGVATGPLALSGLLGGSPLRGTVNGVRVGLGGGFALEAVNARIGRGDAPVILSAAALMGRIGAGGAATGDFRGGGARIASVPLDLSDLAGRWRFAGGTLDVRGALRVADREADARFNPLRVDDARFRLADGAIVASGTLRHPQRGVDVARVRITHDLGAGTGRADIDADSLRFGPALQPDDLTRFALGVVANVAGTVNGRGVIDWTPQGVTSGGRFSTIGMNLAAAFGPVEGLSTSLDFTDLLALETAPRQLATLAIANPGIEVRDGRILFQLQRDQRVRVEGGEWPFAGGRLILLPTTLDFDARQPRRLAFRVMGLDAGSFINTLQLDNISASGTFDGLLPMIFDATGGRIEGGVLVARQQGLPPLVVESAQGLIVPCDPARQSGLLSYVGEVSNAEMGAMGKLAFDALKKLRYKCLTILLDGAIDGEFVTRVAINGVNQGTAETRKSAFARPFIGLPFLFNVTIQAPFRGLLNTYQSFTDPSTLIRNSLGAQYQAVIGEQGVAVQPSDSDKAIERERE